MHIYRKMGALVLILLALMSARVGHAQSVYVNGKPLQSSVAPISRGGHTMVAMRPIFEALGASVQWNPAARSITARRRTTMIVMFINSRAAKVNGQTLMLARAPLIYYGNTMVPLRFVGESLGARVRFDKDANRIDITTDSTMASGAINKGINGQATQNWTTSWTLNVEKFGVFEGGRAATNLGTSRSNGPLRGSSGTTWDLHCVRASVGQDDIFGMAERLNGTLAVHTLRLFQAEWATPLEAREQDKQRSPDAYKNPNMQLKMGYGAGKGLPTEVKFQVHSGGKLYLLQNLLARDKYLPTDKQYPNDERPTLRMIPGPAGLFIDRQSENIIEGRVIGSVMLNFSPKHPLDDQLLPFTLKFRAARTKNLSVMLMQTQQNWQPFPRQLRGQQALENFEDASKAMGKLGFPLS